MKKRIETAMALVILVLMSFAILGCPKPNQYYFATDPSGFGIYYIEQEDTISCTQACLQGFYTSKVFLQSPSGRYYKRLINGLMMG